MCQLTYSNLHDCRSNGLMIYLLGIIGSSIHDDGTGFISSENKVWKTEYAARNILNLGEIISINITNDNPVPFHIRRATYGIEVTKENSHPFDGKHYILMHNGTLLPRNGQETKDKKHDSDSLKFLNALDECKDIDPNAEFPILINAAMTNFAGKFAFIIREKETGLDYIVRGKTAELWISKFKFLNVELGYVVNTSKETLKDAIKQYINIRSITDNCEFIISEPELLEKETVYLADKLDLKEIGKCSEFDVVKETKLIISSDATKTREKSVYDSDISDIVKRAKKIHTYLSEHCLGLIDFQLMVMIAFNKSILDMDKGDFDYFIENIIPKISASRKVRNEVKQLLNGQYFPEQLYDKLEYPWVVNDPKNVISAIKKYVKERI